MILVWRKGKRLFCDTIRLLIMDTEFQAIENERKTCGMFFHPGFAGIQGKLILQRNVTAAAAARRTGMS